MDATYPNQDLRLTIFHGSEKTELLSAIRAKKYCLVWLSKIFREKNYRVSIRGKSSERDTLRHVMPESLGTRGL
jgi:hypothetical protein